MNDRQRFKAAVLFGVPDKIPLEPGEPRQSTLSAWRKQGLPEDAAWRDALWAAIGLATPWPQARQDLDFPVKMLPAFEEKVLSHNCGHYVVQDWMGAIVEISDEFDCSYLRQPKDFVTRRWLRFPVQTRDDWVEKIKWRYADDRAQRFPPGFKELCLNLKEREEVLQWSIPGPFWQLREWCGLETLCLLMIEQPEFVEEMVAFWEEFVINLMAPVLQLLELDHVQVSEDMAYKLHSMISPTMARRFLLPTWKKWVAALKAGGCEVVSIDSDGYTAELLPLWIEAGFNLAWPVEVAAGNDIVKYRQLYGHQMAFGGGIDKRALAAGGEVMQAELGRVVPLIHQGGYLPGCDHAAPPDISWPNFVEYTRALARLTGWL